MISIQCSVLVLKRSMPLRLMVKVIRVMSVLEIMGTMGLYHCELLRCLDASIIPPDTVSIY